MATRGYWLATSVRDGCGQRRCIVSRSVGHSRRRQRRTWSAWAHRLSPSSSSSPYHCNPPARPTLLFFFLHSFPSILPIFSWSYICSSSCVGQPHLSSLARQFLIVQQLTASPWASVGHERGTVRWNGCRPVAYLSLSLIGQLGVRSCREQRPADYRVSTTRSTVVEVRHLEKDADKAHGCQQGAHSHSDTVECEEKKKDSCSLATSLASPPPPSLMTNSRQLVRRQNRRQHFTTTLPTEHSTFFSASLLSPTPTLELPTWSTTITHISWPHHPYSSLFQFWPTLWHCPLHDHGLHLKGQVRIRSISFHISFALTKDTRQTFLILVFRCATVFSSPIPTATACLSSSASAYWRSLLIDRNLFAHIRLSWVSIWSFLFHSVWQYFFFNHLLLVKWLLGKPSEGFTSTRKFVMAIGKFNCLWHFQKSFLLLFLIE